MNIYIKLSNYCSLGCAHCYLPQETRSQNQIAEPSMLISTLEFVKKRLKDKNESTVNIIWHGGEPLDIDIEVFKERSSFVQQCLESAGVRVFQTIQTSLIPLNRMWLGHLTQNKEIMISVSIDTTARTIGGSSERYLKALKSRVKYAHDGGLKLAANICPSVSDLDKFEQVLNLLDEWDISDFSIDRYNNFSNRVDFQQPTNAQHSQYLINLLNSSLKRISQGRRVSACSTLIAAIDGVTNGIAGDRWGGQCLNENIIINPDGKLNFCPDRIEFEPDFTQDHFQTKIQSLQHDYQQRGINLRCMTCEFNPWCKTGCPIAKENLIDGDCSGHKKLLIHIKNNGIEDPELLRRYTHGQQKDC